MTDQSPPPAAQNTDAPAAHAPRRRRGIFGFLFKSVLGCAAFAFGSLVVLVVCLPWLLQPLARSVIESSFGARFKGTLEVGHVELSWRGTQSVTDAVLFDPEHNRIARVSATLPSIIDAWHFTSNHIAVAVDVEADLVADGEGVTNLMRALEPLQKPEAATPAERVEAEGDPLALLSSLDLDVRVAGRRITWSDAETRRAQTPFELHDLVVTLRMRPREPIVLHVASQVVADAPGAIEIDATIHGPIDGKKAWPFGEVDAKARIEGFSSAMVDGIAGLQGNLKEVLGPRFDVRLAVDGVTPEKGGLELDLASERTNLRFAGRFERGALRAAGDSSVRATIGVPKGFVAGFLAPVLPPGTSIAWEEGEKPWTLTLSNLVVPIPSAPTPDLKSIARAMSDASCDLDLDLPARVSFENEQTRAAGVQAKLDGVRAKVHVAPGSPATVHVETELDTGAKGKLSIDATVAELWKPLAEGATPHADLDVRADAVPTSAIDAIGALGGKLVEAVGPEIRLTFSARDASPESGTFAAEVRSQRLTIGARGRFEGGALRCTGEEGVDLAFDPPAGFVDRQLAPMIPPAFQVSVAAGRVELHAREISVSIAAPFAKGLAGDLTVALPGVRISTEESRAAKVPLVIDGLRIQSRLASEGGVTLAVKGSVDTGAKGALSVDASVGDVWRLTAADGMQNPPPVDARIAVDGLSTAALDALAQQGGLIVEALGASLAIAVEAKGLTRDAGTIRLDLTTPSLSVGFAGRVEKGTLRCADGEDLHVTARSLDKLLAHRLAPSLPAGTQLTLVGDEPIRCTVRDLALPLPGPAAATPATGQGTTLAMLEGLACKLDLVVPGVRFSDEHTRAAKVEPMLRGLTLAVEVAPKKPLAAKLTADVEAGEKGKLDASLSIDDPWFALRGADAKMPPVDARVKLAGMSTKALDALAGKAGMLSELLGARLDLDVSAERASLDGGALKLEVHAPTADVVFAGRIDKGRLLCSGKEGLGATLAIPQAWLDAQVAPHLPQGTVLKLQDGAAPLKLDVREIALALPSPSTSGALAIVSKLALKFDLSLPDFAYSDPRIAASAASPSPAPPPAAGATPTTPAAPATPAPVGPPIVKAFKLHAELSSAAPPSASLRASIEGDPRGELACTLRALDPLALLAEEKGIDRFRVAADVRASKVPTGLVDALAGQDGLLVDVLGARLDLVLKTDSISLSEGNFGADLASDQATLHVDRGSLKDGALVLEKATGKNEAMLARIGLTPLATERVVGNLVPMAVNIQKPAGSDPAVFAVDGLHMPLDGDLSKLDAVVRVSLGEVSYQLLPALASILGGGQAQLVRMPELRVPIAKGVASYDGLPLRIGGRDYVFQGTFNLVDKTFKLGTGVPLSVLGKKFNSQLDAAREFLSPDLVVPLEIRGSWKHPKIGVADEFMKKVVDDALKKQTGNLLDDLLKKKDKKKKD